MYPGDSSIEHDQGIVAPFEFVCLPCASQGVRVVIPPGGECSRCGPVRSAARLSVPAAVVSEFEPIGHWRLGGLAGERVAHYGRRPGWAEQAVRRLLFRDVWLDHPHKLEVPH
jgi:hypothetical protein